MTEASVERIADALGVGEDEETREGFRGFFWKLRSLPGTPYITVGGKPHTAASEFLEMQRNLKWDTQRMKARHLRRLIDFAVNTQGYSPAGCYLKKPSGDVLNLTEDDWNDLVDEFHGMSAATWNAFNTTAKDFFRFAQLNYGATPPFTFEEFRSPFGGRAGVRNTYGRRGKRQSIGLALEPAVVRALFTSMSSGEGLLKTICDPVWALDSRGEPVLRDAGSDDKRVLLLEEEAGSIFIRVAQQEVMGKFLTTAWDSGRLMNVVKDSKMECATPHVSICGHITPDELTDRVTSSHITSGFINRWTMALIRPTAVDDSLVSPEDIVGLDDAILRIRDGLNRFRDSGEHQFVLSDEADKLRRETSVWVRENEEPGAMAHLSVRFQSQMLKLAMVYAAVDGTTVISADHLRAGRAVTAYSLRCARAFWGGVFLDDLTDDFMSLWRGIGYERSRCPICPLCSADTSPPRNANTCFDGLSGTGLLRRAR